MLSIKKNSSNGFARFIGSRMISILTEKERLSKSHAAASKGRRVEYFT